MCVTVRLLLVCADDSYTAHIPKNTHTNTHKHTHTHTHTPTYSQPVEPVHKSIHLVTIADTETEISTNRHIVRYVRVSV